MFFQHLTHSHRLTVVHTFPMQSNRYCLLQCRLILEVILNKIQRMHTRIQIENTFHPSFLRLQHTLKFVTLTGCFCWTCPYSFSTESLCSLWRGLMDAPEGA